MSIPSYFIQSPVVNVDVTNTSKILFLPAASTVTGNTFLIRDITGKCSPFSSIYISTTGLDVIDLTNTTIQLTSSLQSARVVAQSVTNYSAFQNYFAGYSPFTWTFDPASYSDCILWFDASRQDTFTLIPGETNLISSWANLGTQTGSIIGSDCNISGLTGIDTINSLNVVKIALNQEMIGTAFIPNAETTVFVVFQSLLDQQDIGTHIISLFDPTTSNAFQIFVNIYRRNFYYQLGKSDTWAMNAATATNPYNTPQVISFRNTSTLTSNFVHINSCNLTLTSNAVANGFDTAILPYYVNGKTNTSGNSIDLAEIIIYNRGLSDREAVVIEKYLKSKWAIQGTPLPPIQYIVPNNLANCLLWFDPTDKVSLKEQGTIVEYWDNLGTDPNLMANFSLYNPVLTNVDSLGGENLITFQANSSLFDYTAIPDQLKTIFIVFTITYDMAAIYPPNLTIFGGTQTGQLNVSIDYDVGTNKFRYSVAAYGSWSMYVETNDNPYNVPIILTIRFGVDFKGVPSAANNRIYLNKVSQTIVNNQAASGFFTEAITYYFSQSDGGTFTMGDFLLYNASLSDTEVTEVETYLSAKWAII